MATVKRQVTVGNRTVSVDMTKASSADPSVVGFGTAKGVDNLIKRKAQKALRNNEFTQGKDNK
jgi:hypothetical protein